MRSRSSRNDWPDLARLDLPPTTDALQLWSQIVGKVRLMTTPWINHSWHATLYLSARGFTTGLMELGARSFEMEFDLLGDVVRIEAADGEARRVGLGPQSVAAFHDATMRALGELGLAVEICGVPSEIPNALPFREDHAPRAYDGDTARAYWRAMLQVRRPWAAESAGHWAT